jgi:hypothetical protein
MYLYMLVVMVGVAHIRYGFPFESFTSPLTDSSAL